MTAAIIIISVIIVILALIVAGIYFFLFIPNFGRHDEELRPIGEKGFLHEYRDFINPSIEWFKAQKKEDVYITSYDGLKLHAFFLPAAGEPKGTLLLCHGFKGIAERDFGGVYDFYHNLGWNVLLPDHRAHNRSEGKFITFGIKERYDFRDWISFLNTKVDPSLPIFLDGVSMGCSTVLMTTGFQLPSNVKGVIADCGFTTPCDIITSVLKRWYKLPPFPIIPISVLIVKFFAGFDMRGYSTLTALETNRIPVLFAYGEKDDFVPTEMTLQNYEACKAEKYLISVKEAKHADSYFVERERYQAALMEFLDRYSK